MDSAGVSRPPATKRPRLRQNNPVDPIPDYVDLFEHAPVGYMLMDAAGRIRQINQAGAELLGWNRSWLIGKPFSRWVTNNDKQRFQVHQRRLRECSECVREEFRVKNRQGRILSLRLASLSEAGSADGAAAGFRSVLINVSGEEQASRRLRRLQSQLAYMTRLRTAGELASSLAHELNQPLGTVVLNCEAAMRLLEAGGGEDSEFAEALSQAVEAASFASEVVRRLRGFLRQNEELHRVCTLPELMHDVFMLIEPDARDHDIELRLELEDDLPNVRIDPVQIQQVLVNLARNGIEAINTGEAEGRPGSVRISARQEPPGQVHVCVEDSGPGLAPNQTERIFTPLQTTKEDGMGMGLPISRTIVEAHGGRLWATSAVGYGAVLHFTLPVLNEPRYGG
ncbi:MAG: sensor histidine kinase [Gammaproteobacteria bacterium]